MADSSSNYLPLAPESDTLSPLPGVHRRGLIACAVLGSLSFVTSTTVFLYLTVKFVRWHLRTRKQARKDPAAPASQQVDLSLGLAQRLFVADEAAKPPTPPQKERPRLNQFLILIYNLLLADIHQAASFILNAVWVGRDALQVRTATCWVQAWLIQTGDVASSLFITAIAVHTYLAIVKNYTPPQWTVYTAVVALWLFNYLLLVLGVAITDNGKEHGGFFVRATAWCWINVRYEDLRLHLHYLWIFLALAITGGLYTLIWRSLSKRQAVAIKAQLPAANDSSININDRSSVDATTANNHSGSHSHDHNRTTSTSSTLGKPVDHRPTTASNAPETAAACQPQHPHVQGGHHKAFLLYPIIYIVCTAPLALGRIATMAGVDVPVSYFVTAGALITSNGWLDVLLWGVTRHRLIFSSDVDTEDTGLNTFTFMRTPHDRRWGNMVWVQGGAGSGKAGAKGGDKKNDGEGGTRMLGALGKRRVGWRELKLKGAGTPAAGSSREDGDGVGGRDGNEEANGKGGQGGSSSSGWGIQMDTVTTVVVEEASEVDRMTIPVRYHTPSASLGSNLLPVYDPDADSALDERMAAALDLELKAFT
ncbi:hypothetical protein VTJ83DRAFT_4340 [Remersonia thermophila]|uniref:Glucose receptor Git3 N-terminal domain-containing protein n=1 Tax=Remersonia thermophila TaxID=72144 RepID=A0ABR4D9P8_9PEZI